MIYWSVKVCCCDEDALNALTAKKWVHEKRI